jgi:hypothetical protein
MLVRDAGRCADSHGTSACSCLKFPDGLRDVQSALDWLLDSDEAAARGSWFTKLPVGCTLMLPDSGAASGVSANQDKTGSAPVPGTVS